jgi:hypothetical protein
MAVYSKKELSALVGIEPKNISVYHRRGKLQMIDGKIDTENLLNAAFLEKYRGRNSSKITNPETEPNKVPPITPPTDDILIIPTESQSYTESERQLKYLDTLKRKKEIEKLDIEIAKKKGEVVPTELLNPIVLQNNQSMVTQFKYTVDEIIRIFSAKMQLSGVDQAEIRGKCIKEINKASDKATEATINAIEVIINEYSEKRGVGERGV